MRGKQGLFSLFTGSADNAGQEDKDDVRRRRRRHSSGDRETWSRKVEYFFASLGYAVGLGNVWRFPYLCYRNGGGAFLIPYILALVAVGLPLIFMEMSFGQFASLGPITIWRICPLFKGIGYSIVVVLVLVNTYYNVLIAYALFFLFASITDELPWSRCDNKWNTDFCIIERCSEVLQHNKTGNATGPIVWSEETHCHLINSTVEFRAQLKTPTEEFFENHLLRKSNGIDELGAVQWPLIVCLAVSWFTCFICLFKGIKSMGKAVIFTTIFSYLILTVLLIRGLTLPGSVDGIIFYLKPDWSKLGQLQVWGEASAQAFASLSLGGGGWITLSSYNKFKNRCNRDSILVGIGNAVTSLYAGFVIFSVLGYMAHIKGVSVSHVTKRGPGLAFVAYPEGLSLIPGAPFWAICFFFMMFTVGLDSLFGQVETIVGGIIDEFPETLRPRRKLFTFFMCTIMFFMGIPLITQGGIYIVTLMDWYTLLFSFSIISLTEVIVIIYIYGFKRFSEDIKMMLGIAPNMYYMITWLAVSPLTLVLVIIFLFVRYIPPEFGDYTFPPYALSIGWGLALGPCALIPITMIFMFFYRSGGCDVLRRLPTDASARWTLFNNLLTPTDEWGPALPDNFRKYSASHGKGMKDEVGEDEVFGDGCELTDYKSDPENRQVKFSDELTTPTDDRKPLPGSGDVAVEISGENSAKQTKEEPKEDQGLLNEDAADKKDPVPV